MQPLQYCSHLKVCDTSQIPQISPYPMVLLLFLFITVMATHTHTHTHTHKATTQEQSAPRSFILDYINLLQTAGISTEAICMWSVTNIKGWMLGLQLQCATVHSVRKCQYENEF